MSDQHTARVMGCAGNKAADTPNLDRLAESGTRFTRAYCPSPVCLPSRMSMPTGMRPHEQECWTNDDILNSGIPTWLHALGAAGYKPVLIGRMHALGPDQLHGYNARIIGDHSPAWPGVARRSLGALNKTSGPFKESIANEEAMGGGTDPSSMTNSIDTVFSLHPFAIRIIYLCFNVWRHRRARRCPIDCA